MLPQNDFIISTCIYNRTNSIKTYMESLLTPENRKSIYKFHIYLTLNFDELWPKHQAIDDMSFALGQVDWQKLGLTAREAKDWYDVLPTPNIGLSGYNLGFEISKSTNYCHVLCCNDDTVFPKEQWMSKLLVLPTEVYYDSKGSLAALSSKQKIKIRPESIGIVAPTYIHCGSMRHQQYQPDEDFYIVGDFCVGHVQMVTTNALRKGFRYEPAQCTGFGSYDIYQSMWMCANELNTVMHHSLPFDFPESKESHFHNGLSNRWDNKLSSVWKGMTANLDVYQAEHIKKHNGNKWFWE